MLRFNRDLNNKPTLQEFYLKNTNNDTVNKASSDCTNNGQKTPLCMEHQKQKAHPYLAKVCAKIVVYLWK